MKGNTNESGRPFLVYHLTDEQSRAILDYFFTREKVTSLRALAKVLDSSVQGADNMAHKVLGQWARQGKVCPAVFLLDRISERQKNRYPDMGDDWNNGYGAGLESALDVLKGRDLIATEVR